MSPPPTAMEIEMKNANRIPSVPGKSRFAMEHWFNTLYLRGLLFHPDDQPENIVRVGTGKLAFTPQECKILREGIQVMFDCHGDQVYDVALEYCMKTMAIREPLLQ
jgi:hypothetical protein